MTRDETIDALLGSRASLRNDLMRIHDALVRREHLELTPASRENLNIDGMVQRIQEREADFLMLYGTLEAIGHLAHERRDEYLLRLVNDSLRDVRLSTAH